MISNVAISIGSLIALCSAWIAKKIIDSNRDISKKSKTADFLFASRSDNHYLDGLTALKERHASEFNFRCLVHIDRNDKRSENKKIRIKSVIVKFFIYLIFTSVFLLV